MKLETHATRTTLADLNTGDVFHRGERCYYRDEVGGV